MKVLLNSHHPHEIVKAIGQQLGINSIKDCYEQKLKLIKNKGDGEIIGFEFSDGLSLLLFDCTLMEDCEIVFSKNHPAPLLFNFNVSGEIWHFYDNYHVQYHLNTLEGSITANPFHADHLIRFPGQRRLTFAMLMIDRAKYIKKIDCMLEQMPKRLRGMFSDTDCEQSFFYQGNYSIAASEIIKKITLDKNTDIVRSTFIEGKVLELLARQIKQFRDDLLAPAKQSVLRKYDVDKIINARDLLVKDIKNAPTIEELAREAGINQQKLKTGFKVVFETTINKYLRNERLELASILLLQGYSVRETSNEVGYSNQSHFAGRFREKYGVLPKDYLKSIRQKGQA